MRNSFNVLIVGVCLCFANLLALAEQPKAGVLTKVRFFGMPGHEQDLLGGKIVASNDPSLPNEESNGLPITIDKFTVLGEIKTAPTPGQWGELPIENNFTPYRWIAYAAPPGSHGRIAEIEFYSGDRKLLGNAFNAWAPEHVSRYATDGNVKSYYDSQYADHQFAGLDIGALATGPAPKMTPAEGEYKDAMMVTLTSAQPGAVIRYTLDGTLPTASRGELYTKPIPISKTTTITAIAFHEGLAPTPPTYSTYIIGSAARHTEIFQIGNSLTQVGSAFDRQAITGGHINHDVIWGIGGARTKKLWDAAMTPDVDPTYKEYNDRWIKQWPTLTNIDHFTMQPRDFDIPEEADYDIRWMKFVRQKAPFVQPWLYIEWTEMARKRPTDLGVEPTSEMRKVWPAATWEESMAAMVLYGEDLERKIKETYKEGQAPRILPTALAMGWFHQIEKGENGLIYCGVVGARPGMTIKAIAYKSGMADSAVTESSY